MIDEALKEIEDNSQRQTDGKWLEELTVRVAPHIRDWDIAECWTWADWPDRLTHFPTTTLQDVGCDAVATRRSDGALIAIQCKAKRLDESGTGGTIGKDELDSFGHFTASKKIWEERWLITNGNTPLTEQLLQTMEASGTYIHVLNIASELEKQRSYSAIQSVEDCGHCDGEANTATAIRSKQCMQNEAVSRSVEILQAHYQSDSGGIPEGQARGKIILPCGTGKTRISLRIVEQLSPLGSVSVVLCPSIALVSQLRREYLNHTKFTLRPLAVCSDKTAAYNPRSETAGSGLALNPTLDTSFVSELEVKGDVTTDPEVIKHWLLNDVGKGKLNVIFGTYQSGYRIGEALVAAGITAEVLIADEAHRTAGLRRIAKMEQKLRDFTVCHNNELFPAKYRVYQTATPRVYGGHKQTNRAKQDWIVRDMDDATVFGVELYRKTYREAVDNKWLADYRIIALGINDPESSEVANQLARRDDPKKGLSSAQFIKGMVMALVLAGATKSSSSGSGDESSSGSDGNPTINSCIAFMNTVAKSKSMAANLTTQPVLDWIDNWLSEFRTGTKRTPYQLEHLDAKSRVTEREEAKKRLSQASPKQAHAVTNVGIFGEGTDSPNLSAVAFLEPRKSPIDVIQAVGRVMRTAKDKELGYIICPLLIPPNANAEDWLQNSSMEDGWQELGQILLALRAHDSRIEDSLSDLMIVNLPPLPEEDAKIVTVVAFAGGESNRISYRLHVGKQGQAVNDVEDVVLGKKRIMDVSHPFTDEVLNKVLPLASASKDGGQLFEHGAVTTVITGKPVENASGNMEVELRRGGVKRDAIRKDGYPGRVNIKKTKDVAREMINKNKGTHVPPREARKPRPTIAIQEAETHRLFEVSGLNKESITANLLAKSGLTGNRIVRDANLLEDCVREAARHLEADELTSTLNKHFNLDALGKDKLDKQADGCTTAALLMMNAAMLHQRIAAGGWLHAIPSLESIKNKTNIVRSFDRAWNDIKGYDFKPVVEPALKVIHKIEDTERRSGLEVALQHIATEAERLAASYADMGADHAGPLFNRVMGNQTSDGAYFTRPVAASLAARLALDVCGKDADWSDPQTWREHKSIDLACGSGTLLAALLTEMKRRARLDGASQAQIAEFQRLAVEEVLKGMDFNPVSLQLAAAQLTQGNLEIRYSKMGLFEMPYGMAEEGSDRKASAGTLELIGQTKFLKRSDELDLGELPIGEEGLELRDDAELEEAVDAAKDCRIVIMNPPFTNRTNMGEKFLPSVQEALRERVDRLEDIFVSADVRLDNVMKKTTIEPIFSALAQTCLSKNSNSTITMIAPTVKATASSSEDIRLLTAERLHVHTILTCHDPYNINLSQETSINESIFVFRPRANCEPPVDTRIISLDKFPANELEVEELHSFLNGEGSNASNDSVGGGGGGAVSYWPAERVARGDWTAVAWRSPVLAEAASKFAENRILMPLASSGRSGHSTGRQLSGTYEPSTKDSEDVFPVLKSKGANAQETILASPDQLWRHKKGLPSPILKKAGHLLVSAGQDTSTGRLTAVASDQKYVGGGWTPVTECPPNEAKALAVFISSTVGRLLLMRNPGKKLTFPGYNVDIINSLPVCDIKDERIRDILADCWEATKDTYIPQYKEGECEVRQLWDKAVCEAMGWDYKEITKLRLLLHQEPHVRGLAYGQYDDELEGD